MSFLSQITKHLSIFNEVNQRWVNEKFDGKYTHTKQFCGGNDTIEAYKKLKNVQYSETDIDYHYNENGFRIPHKDCIYEDNRPTIACFGCSDTFGVGLPWKETWPAQLEELLNNNFSIKNYGLCGASGDQIARLVSVYLQNHTPRALLCMLPDIFRREYFENNRNKLSLKQFYLIDDIPIPEGEKPSTLKDVNTMDWWAYNRLSKPDNSIYNLIKNIKFIEAIAMTKSVPLYIFSWDEYLINVFYKKHFTSPCICVPTKQEIDDLEESYKIKARDNCHSGVNTCRVFASIFHRHIV